MCRKGRDPAAGGLWLLLQGSDRLMWGCGGRQTALDISQPSAPLTPEAVPPLPRAKRILLVRGGF